jgi:hypothetical protein
MKVSFLSFLVVLLLGASCGGSNKVEQESLPTPTVSLSSPAEAFATWISALQRDDFDTAMNCLYLPMTNQISSVRESLGPHAEKIRMQKWNVKIAATGEQGRFAAIIYTTAPDRTDYDPVLAVRQTNGEWKLHQREISGGLSYLFKGKEYDTAMQVVRWGRDKINDMRIKQLQKQEEAEKKT